MMANSIKGVHIPFPALARLPVKFRFVSPASVNLVGSYLLRAVAKPTLNVDVAVEMPQVRVCVCVVWARAGVFKCVRRKAERR